MQDSNKLFEIGNEALEKINTKYVVRSRIAKWLSLLALEEQKKDELVNYRKVAERCAEEWYRR